MRTPTVFVRALPALTFTLFVALVFVSPVSGGEWNNWRGPHYNGVADDTGLISGWSTEGENLLWRADFTGRSTAAVFDGRACAMGRDGEGIRRQEVVVCWDAEDGEKLWERRFTPHNTFVPWQR
ncbi:MAG: serine/threonine protein kinase, partial [Acidobacteriota bacterium]|nr:serine/threonine protein kinase [Acidobacteriota bacterium]